MRCEVCHEPVTRIIVREDGHSCERPECLSTDLRALKAEREREAAAVARSDGTLRTWGAR